MIHHEDIAVNNPSGTRTGLPQSLQKQLTIAQIDLIKQRASAMSSGDPMITVSGDGLQPHLEAFMWEILSAIQVRVNEDYGNFLLGIGAA